MMDISDGLLLDASRMAEASGVDHRARSGTGPVPADLPPARLREALSWGDDYQLLFTLPPATEPPCSAHRIGMVRAGRQRPAAPRRSSTFRPTWLRTSLKFSTVKACGMEILH
jgi:thiamine-monophosphate kinase